MSRESDIHTIAHAAPLSQIAPAAAVLGTVGTYEPRFAIDAETLEYERYRRNRWDYQRTAHKLVWQHVNATDDKRHSFTSCGCVVGGAEEFARVDYSASTERASYGNLSRCESIACPICAPLKAATNARPISDAIKAALLDGRGIAHVTYTMQHKKSASLHDSNTLFLDVQQKMRRQRAFKALQEKYGWLASVRVAEITYTQANGWHPHRHEIILLERPLSDDEQEDFEYELWSIYAAKLEQSGGYCTRTHGIRATFGDSVAQQLADYVAKHGHPPKDDGNPTAHKAAEATNHIHKQSRSARGQSPLELLAAAHEGDRRAAALWLEYYLETKHRHWMSGVKKFCDAAGVDRDESAEIAKDEFYENLDSETVLHLTQHELTALTATGNRVKLLETVERSGGNPAVAAQFVAEVLANFDRVHAQRPPPLGVGVMTLDDLNQMEIYQ